MTTRNDAEMMHCNLKTISQSVGEFGQTYAKEKVLGVGMVFLIKGEKMNAKKGSKWYMGGTEGTGQYLVVVIGSLGKVGYRDLGCGNFRVRVEPVEMAASTVLAPFFAGWKKPDVQMRFSQVVYNETSLKTTVAAAIDALATVNHLQANPKAPKWAKEYVKMAVATVEATAKAIEAAKKAALKKSVPKAKPAKKVAAKKPAKIKKAA